MSQIQTQRIGQHKLKLNQRLMEKETKGKLITFDELRDLFSKFEKIQIDTLFQDIDNHRSDDDYDDK